jgi:hypothetical protein
VRERVEVETDQIRVYPASSAERPWAAHTDGSIDEGDYTQLIDVLTRALGGTGQPLPGQGATRIWYLEDGFQTQVKPDKRRFYTGRETERTVIPPLQRRSPQDALPVVDQATQLQRARTRLLPAGGWGRSSTSSCSTTTS